MKMGFNKADTTEKLLWSLKRNKTSDNRPCIFLSHKREDKAACKEIAEYFKNANIDYYLDENDEALQRAAAKGDPKLTTDSIKTGISDSSHMFVVVSEKTFTSPWVPFEIGYGLAAIIDKHHQEGGSDKLRLAVLILKDLSEKRLPDFMKTAHIIRGRKTLMEYLIRVLNSGEKSVKNRLLFESIKESHPLDNVLNSEY